MKVTLAYPFDGHAADETIEVDDATARGLLRGGNARLPDLPDEGETPSIVTDPNDPEGDDHDG